jgi:hypothetical protein
MVSDEHQEHSLRASDWVLSRESQDLLDTTVGVPRVASEPDASLTTSAALRAALRSRCGLLTLGTLGCAALNGLDDGLDSQAPHLLTNLPWLSSSYN